MSKGSAFSLRQRDVDHRQHRTLAVEDAVQETREDDVVDVVGIELGDVLGTQLRHRTVQIPRGQRLITRRRIRSRRLGAPGESRH